MQTAAQPIYTASSTASRPRLDSVDLLRGLVMIVMALDHTRDFFSNAGVDPMDLAKTNPALFFTRWITHFCAPVFIFLAGTGAFLAGCRGKSKRELSWFLFSRGLWLVFLDITAVRSLGWYFNFDYHFVYVGVIWAIGWSMVVLAGLVWLPIPAIAAFGVGMIAGHNLLDAMTPESCGPFAWLWRILHVPHSFKPLPGVEVSDGYPLIPWMGVMASGFAFGAILQWDAAKRRRWIFGLGAVLVAGFVLLRGLNQYGDPNPWTEQKSALSTLFSFLNCQKYPPSLLYVLMTLGPALLILAAFDRPLPRVLQPAVVFGRVPLFFYLLHLPLIHGLAVLIAFAQHGKAGWLFANPPDNVNPQWGFGLPGVYLAWLAAILILYPLCRWFAEIKRRRKDAWLSYL